VFAINTLAPFILNSKLKPAMASPFLDLDGISKTRPAFIVNVSAMEGTWARHKAGAVGGGGGIRCAGCTSHHNIGCVRLS
jgi:NAD(P)-dependent dehydrogenase (short-subunit alcohol dehydrogenase family)